MESEDLDETKLRREARNDRSVFFLVDHQQGQPPPFADAFTVAAMSPDTAMYKEWEKTRCVVLWMPLTTENELLAMNSIEPQLSVEVLRSRIQDYGPIIGLAFNDDQNSVKAKLRTRLSSFKYEECLRRVVLLSSDLPKGFDGISWWILHATTSDYRQPSKMEWASRSIMQDVLAKVNQNRLGELEYIIADGLANPVRSHDVDGEFQYWACQRLSCGGLDLPTFSATYVGGKCQYALHSNLHIPVCPIELVQNLPTVAAMVGKRGVLLYSKLTNEPLCDAAMVLGNELLLFQMTIGEDHGFRLPTWMTYCKAAADANLASVRFLFVVPFRDKFQVKQSS